MRRFPVDFASNRLAFHLMGILLTLILLSALIPQEEFASGRIVDWRDTLGSGYRVIEVLQLDRIYVSPPFFVVLGLLGVNLAVANVKRFRLVYRVEGTLLRARHLGSIVFHLALLLILVAVILNYLYKSQGVFALTEGQTGHDLSGEYFRRFDGPLHDSTEGRFQVVLEAVESRPVGETTAETARLRLTPRDGGVPVEASIRINRAFRWRGLEFHLGDGIGYSPEVVVLDPEGVVAFRSFVRLANREIEGERLASDYVPVDLGEPTLGVEIVPAAGGIERRVWIERDGDRLHEASIAPGDTAAVGAWRVAIPRLRRWAFVEVVRSPFLNLVFTGFWLGLAGMVVGFVPRIVGRRGWLR